MLMSVMLVGVISLFMTSCVQGDLCDELYEDYDVGFIQRSKKWKDVQSLSLSEAQSHVLKNSFDCTECECWACAMYNYANATGRSMSRYSIRESIGKTLFGDDWKVPYTYYTKYSCGIPAYPNEESYIIYKTVGAMYQSFLRTGTWNNGSIIVGLYNGTHFGVACGFRTTRSGLYDVKIKDQCGVRWVSCLDIDSYYWA